MQKLIQGIHHFESNLFRSQREFFENLADGQKPEALFITCSDSRVIPHLITHTEPGDLFTLRNAGNIVPPYGSRGGGEEATIEYAVSVLGVRDIIVCGHTHCGAMAGLLNPETVAHLPGVKEWLGYAEATRRIIQENYGHLEGEALLTAAVEENTLVQLENLRSHPAVASRITRGKIALHAWVYHIARGKVFSYDPLEGQFVPIVPGPTDLTAVPEPALI